MKTKKMEPDNIICICGEKARGFKRHKYYLVICDKCGKKSKFDNKKLYQETIYTMLIRKNGKFIKVMAICNNCKESLYHDYKYQFCVKCRVVKYFYR